MRSSWIRLQYKFQIYAAPAVGLQCYWTVPGNTGMRPKRKLRAVSANTYMQQKTAGKFLEQYYMHVYIYTPAERAPRRIDGRTRAARCIGAGNLLSRNCNPPRTRCMIGTDGFLFKARAWPQHGKAFYNRFEERSLEARLRCKAKWQ